MGDAEGWGEVEILEPDVDSHVVRQRSTSPRWSRGPKPRICALVSSDQADQDHAALICGSCSIRPERGSRPGHDNSATTLSPVSEWRRHDLDARHHASILMLE